MTFDPTDVREHGFSPAMIASDLDRGFDPAQPMGNIAATLIATTVRATLVGLYDTYAPKLPLWIDWLGTAIRDGEAFGDDGALHRAKLHRARALARWLHDDSDAVDDWAAAWQGLDSRWQGADRWTRTELGLTLDIALACVLQSNDRASMTRAVDVCQRLTGTAPPARPQAARTPRAYGCLLCLEATGAARYEADALDRAGRALLRANLEANWFGDGQNLQAASWLRIVYRRTDPTLDAPRVLLRAYDDMPRVERPDFG